MRTPTTLRVLAGLALASQACLPTIARADGDGSDYSCEHAKLEAVSNLTAAGFSEATGEDTRNFAPTRIADIQHMKLDLFIPDMNKPTLTGTQTLRLTPFAEMSSLTLDAKAMTINSVSAANTKATFTYNDNKLTVTFDPPLPQDQTAQLITTYTLNDPPRGLIWTPESPAWPGRAAQLHTQGQPQSNSYWFPAHDFPNERMTTEIIATVPAGYLVSANGKQLSQERVIRRIPAATGPRLQPYDRFHWLQDKEHVAYLVSLIVGKFDVVDLSSLATKSKDKNKSTLPLPVYVPPGRANDVARTYANTGPMIDLFASKLDEPYPWDRYAQLVAWNFEAGGMENTSATTMYDTAVFSEQGDLDNDLDGLIAHELAHQWFGDLITCNTWEHIWLNEGFATYMEAIWFEQRDGEAGYQREVLNDFDRVLSSDNGRAPSEPGMASKVYAHPWETFRRSANPYPKGAMTLHMLRERMGEELFWQCMQAYVERSKFTTVETSEFRRVLEDVSGLSLEQFFEQWTARPGLPEINVKFTYFPDRNKLRFVVQQMQAIDGDNPAFAFTFPVFIKNTAGPDVIIDPEITNARQVFEVDLEGPPAFVSVNSRAQVLGKFTIEQSPEQWTKQLENAPTSIARVFAARALAPLATTDAVADATANQALRNLALDASQPMFVRTAAIKSLEGRNAKNDIRSLVTTSREAWEIRQQISQSLAALVTRSENISDQSLRDFATTILLQRAATDQSQRVRAESMKALATMRVNEATPIFLNALQTSSQHDIIRQGALAALAIAQPQGAIEAVIPYTREGYLSRTRAEAISSLAKLASQNPTRAKDALLAALQGRENRPRMAAARALVEIGDKSAITNLATLATELRSPELAAQLQTMQRELEAK
ncbi:aminopeptidase [Phycisphaerae bacterium]|nr:aminopeptidase [Phycisphaerae bacterium]